MEYFNNGAADACETAECSDNSCPCSPAVKFHRGEGYLFVSRKAVEFRRNARSNEESLAKMLAQPERLLEFMDRENFTGIMICKQAAKLRNLDIAVAADDARRWWDTGDMPLRPTPVAK